MPFVLDNGLTKLEKQVPLPGLSAQRATAPGLPGSKAPKAVSCRPGGSRGRRIPYPRVRRGCLHRRPLSTSWSSTPSFTGPASAATQLDQYRSARPHELPDGPFRSPGGQPAPRNSGMYLFRLPNIRTSFRRDQHSHQSGVHHQGQTPDRRDSGDDVKLDACVVCVRRMADRHGAALLASPLTACRAATYAIIIIGIGATFAGALLAPKMRNRG